MTPDLARAIDAVLPRIRELRRDLHQYPELGYEETRTAARVARELADLPGVTLRTGVAGTGIVATLVAGTGPAVALRADMDALPITEESGVPHSSKVPGKSHACGHDGHTASLVGAAVVLSRLRDSLPCPVKFLFQPAEEGGAGAKRMVDEGALDNPPVAAVFGYHNWPSDALPFGTIATRPGAFMAATGLFTITVHGRGGHAAAPHQTVDPIIAAAQIVTALQTVVSRNHDPVNSGVVSVTQFHAGTAFNVIPPAAELRGTIRALDDAVLALAARRVTEIAEGVAAALGARAEVALKLNYPVLRNDSRAVGHIAAVARALGRGGRLELAHPPIMGGEDFAFYGAKVPACFWFLASKPDDVASVPGCHHPAFDFNDDILPLAIAMHVETARSFRGLAAG